MNVAQWGGQIWFVAAGASDALVGPVLTFDYDVISAVAGRGLLFMSALAVETRTRIARTVLHRLGLNVELSCI